MRRFIDTALPLTFAALFFAAPAAVMAPSMVSLSETVESIEKGESSIPTPGPEAREQQVAVVASL